MRHFFLILATAMLTACGGGGSSSGSNTNSQNNPLEGELYKFQVTAKNARISARVTRINLSQFINRGGTHIFSLPAVGNLYQLYLRSNLAIGQQATVTICNGSNVSIGSIRRDTCGDITFTQGSNAVGYDILVL